MMSRDHYETAYAVLANFLLIVQRAPVIFSQVRYHHEPVTRNLTAARMVDRTCCKACVFALLY